MTDNTTISQHGANTYVTLHVYDDDKPNTLTINRDGFAQYRKDIHVVTFDTRGNVILRTAGYYTATTKRRMNEAADHYGLGFRVIQRSKQWRVVFADGRADQPFGSDGWVYFRR